MQKNAVVLNFHARISTLKGEMKILSIAFGYPILVCFFVCQALFLQRSEKRNKAGLLKITKLPLTLQKRGVLNLPYCI
jgi:hypothetical protein